MDTITVCIILTALIVVIASVMFAATVTVVAVSYGMKRASTTLWTACRGWIPVMISEARPLPGMAPRRSR